MKATLLHSPENGTDYHLFTHAPGGRDAPLLLVLDGDDQFAAACEALDGLRAEKALEAVTLVGVGYGGSYRSPANRRVRDYTHSQPADEPMEAGGAETFLAFLENTLLPHLSERFVFPMDSVGLGGHSLGSLLGLYALAQPRTLFSRFLVSSPSIWWDNRSILRDISAAGRAEITPRKAFLSIGEEDTPSMLGDLELLEHQLQREPVAGLYHVVRRFPGKDHYNVLTQAYAEGLRWLYA